MKRSHLWWNHFIQIRFWPSQLKTIIDHLNSSDGFVSESRNDVMIFSWWVRMSHFNIFNISRTSLMSECGQIGIYFSYLLNWNLLAAGQHLYPQPSTWLNCRVFSCHIYHKLHFDDFILIPTVYCWPDVSDRETLLRGGCSAWRFFLLIVFMLRFEVCQCVDEAQQHIRTC